MGTKNNLERAQCASIVKQKCLIWHLEVYRESVSFLRSQEERSTKAVVPNSFVAVALRNLPWEAHDALPDSQTPWPGRLQQEDTPLHYHLRCFCHVLGAFSTSS